MKKVSREVFFQRLKAKNPKPRTELRYASEFQLLVSVILSAQATDVSVNKATPALFEVAPDARSMLGLGERELRGYIRSIGLFNSKAKNIIKTSRILVDEFGGAVPRDRKNLERLAGVGRKTANVVLNTAFGEPTIAVDTHIFRVANRTRLGIGKTPLAVEKALLKSVPQDYRGDAHHWLILHGRYTCFSRNPRCGACAVSDLCEWNEKDRYSGI